MNWLFSSQLFIQVGRLVVKLIDVDQKLQQEDDYVDAGGATACQLWQPAVFSTSRSGVHASATVL